VPNEETLTIVSVGLLSISSPAPAQSPTPKIVCAADAMLSNTEYESAAESRICVRRCNAASALVQVSNGGIARDGMSPKQMSSPQQCSIASIAMDLQAPEKEGHDHCDRNID
jgi:hypothetical protein